MLPIDRTSKSTLDTNLVNGNTSDAPAIKNSNDVVYNTIDELNAKVDGLVGSSALSPYPPSFLSRQALINPNFDVWQRGTSFTNPIGLYLSDHWRASQSSGGGTYPTVIHSKQTLTTGDIPNAYNYFRTNVDGPGTALGSSAEWSIVQPIEFGTRYLAGAGKKVTVSFWAKSDIVGKKIGVYLMQNYGSGGTPTSSEIINGKNWSLTSAWTRFSFTFTLNTLVGKIFGSNNDDTLALNITKMWGASTAARLGAGTTAETFVGAGNIDIAQIQVNAGDQVLPFQQRSFAEELSLCQRYYEKSYDINTAPATDTINGAYQWRSPVASTQTFSYPHNFKVPKRTAGTATIYAINGSVLVNNVRKNGTLNIPVGVGNGGTNGFIMFFTAAQALALDDYLNWQWVYDAEI